MTTFPRNNTAEISKMPVMPTPTPVVAATPHPSAHPSAHPSSSAFHVPLPNSHNQSGGCQGPMSRLHRIASPSDLSQWKKSETCQDLQAFVAAVGTACNGITTAQRQADFEARTDAQPQTDGVRAIARIVDQLKQLRALCDTHPPRVDADRRFGNPAFREWHDAMVARAAQTTESILPTSMAAHAGELAAYWQGSFGDRTRIDYGTGHELSFVALLYCLGKLGVLTTSESADIGLVAFDAYLQLTRHLQTAYNLEPAGSHGAWGLDDYCFLPFLFGAGQLMAGAGDANEVTVKAVVTDDRVAEMRGGEWLYVDAVKFVQSVKTGGRLGETSPMLCDIAYGVSGWDKVFTGMKRMWAAEVLGKLPIMQHFVFGKILPFDKS